MLEFLLWVTAFGFIFVLFQKVRSLNERIEYMEHERLLQEHSGREKSQEDADEPSVFTSKPITPPPIPSSPYARRTTKTYTESPKAPTPIPKPPSVAQTPATQPPTTQPPTTTQPTLEPTSVVESSPSAETTPVVEPLPIAQQTPVAKSTTGVPLPPASVKAPPYTSRATRRRETTTRTSKEWEMLVGGKILNRIGSIAVLLGVVFFMKYAFDNNWITPAMRCILGGVAGLGLIALAERTRKKGLLIFTQGVVAAGVPLIFFSIYAAYNYYSLLSQPVAFLLLVAATVGSIALALRHRSMFLVVMSVVFGMLVPALLPSGHINTAALHTYILLLDVGLVAMVVGLKRWRVVASLAAACTWIWWTVWLNAISIGQLEQDRPLALALFIAAGLLFTLSDLVFTRIGIRFDKTVERALSTASALAWSALLTNIVPSSAEWIQGSFVFSAMLYLVLTWLGVRTVSNERAFALQYVVLAAVMFGFASCSNLVRGWVGSGETHSLLLHSFILLLDLCLIATVLRFKRWLPIVAVAALGTWIWWLCWLVHIPNEQLMLERSLALSFLVASGMLFTIVDVICIRIGLRHPKAWDRLIPAASSLAWSTLLVCTVDPTAEWVLGAFAFSALWHLGLTWYGAKRLAHEALFSLQYVSLATLMVFAACLSSLAEAWFANTQNSLMLHSIILVLDLCLLGTVLGLKRWTWIVWITAVGTWLWWVGALFHLSDQQMLAERTMGIVLLCAFGVLFTISDLLCVRLGLRFDKALERILSSVSSIVWTSLLLWLVDVDEQWAQGMLVIAGCWFGVVTFFGYRFVRNDMQVASQYGTLATVMIGAACLLNMTHHESIRSLACVALVSLWISQRLRLGAPTVAAVVIAGISVCWTLAAHAVHLDSSYTLLLNDRMFTFAVVISAVWLIGLRLASSAMKDALNFSRMFRVAAYMLLLVGVHEEVLEYFLDVAPHSTALIRETRHYLGMAYAPAVTALVATLLYVGATRMQRTLLQFASMVGIMITTFIWMLSTFEYYPDASYAPIFNTRLMSGMIVVGCHAVAYLIGKSHPRTSAELSAFSTQWHRPTLAFALLFTTFQLASLEAVWNVVVDIRVAAAVTNGYDPLLVRNLWNAFHLILSSTWIVYAAVLMVIGFLRRVAAIRIAAMVLLGISILKVFLYDLSFLGQPYRIVSFIALGVILLAASYIYARFRHVIMGKEEPPSGPLPEDVPSSVGDEASGDDLNPAPEKV